VKQYEQSSPGTVGVLMLLDVLIGRPHRAQRSGPVVTLPVWPDETSPDRRLQRGSDVCARYRRRVYCAMASVVTREV
jgi:hypothetical protein